MKNTTAIIDLIYPEVEKSLDKNTQSYKKYLSKFINSRASQFYANAPYSQIYFTADDVDELFKSLNIEKRIIKNGLKNTYYYSKANFNPSYAKDECTVLLLCIVRYFYLKKNSKDLDLALINIGFSGKYYPSLWYRSFRIPPQEHIMEYVVSHMTTNKYDIVREGSVVGAVKSICNTWISSYDKKFKEFTDDDCQYLIQQLHNRIGSFIINIAKLYYEAYENKEYITYDSDDVSEDNYRLADSDSFKLERAVTTTLNYMNSHGVDQLICKRSSSNLVKIDELKSIIENILSNPENAPLVKEYITLMIACYFQESPTKDVRDISFITYSIRAKPNSKNKYIIRSKEVLNIILTNNSEMFSRRRNSAPTEQAYYRAINSYFALLIQEVNK